MPAPLSKSEMAISREYTNEEREPELTRTILCPNSLWAVVSGRQDIRKQQRGTRFLWNFHLTS